MMKFSLVGKLGSKHHKSSLQSKVVKSEAVDDHLAFNQNEPILIDANTLLQNDVKGYSATTTSDDKSGCWAWSGSNCFWQPYKGCYGSSYNTNTANLSIVSVQDAVNGQVSLVNGKISFVPNPGYSGPAQFTYTLSDGMGGTDKAYVKLGISAVNQAPNAVDDAFAGTSGLPIVITPNSLLANDYDAEGKPITIVSVQGAENGTVAVVNGNIVFTPNAGYTGEAKFTYTLSDAAANNVQTNLVFNQLPVGYSATLPNGWMSDNPNGQVEINVSTVYGIPGEPRNVIELERGKGEASNLYTTVNSVKDQPVSISFDYSARAGFEAGDNSAIHLLIDGKIVGTANTHTVGFTPLSVTVAGTGAPMRVEFKAVDSNSLGGLLDNIKIISSDGGLTDTATVNINVGLAAPLTPADMTAETDTGISNLDNLTRDDSPDFAVSNAGNHKVNLYVDGVKTPATYNPATGLVTPDAPLAEGEHVIHYTLTGYGANAIESAPSPSLSIVIDTTAPTISSTSSTPDMTAATDTGLSDEDNRTNDNTPSFEIAAPENNIPALYIDGVLVPATFDASNNTLTPNAPIAEGIHQVTYTLTDGAGNESAQSTALPIEIDTSALMTFAPPDMTADTDSGLSNSDDITNNNTPDFEIQVPEGYAPNLYIDGVKVTATYNLIASTLTPVNAIADGVHTISYSLIDTAGNESPQSAPLPILIDTTAPIIYSSLDMTAETDTGLSQTDDVTGDSTPDFAIEDPAGNLPTLYVDGIKVEATFNAQNNTLTPNVPLKEGAHNISYTLTDLAGNESAQSTPLAIEIAIAPINTAPDAVDDSITIVADGPFALTPEMGIQVLSNDTDADGDPLTIISKQNVVGGSIEYVDGVPIFTPTPGYTGPASFEYTISDGKGGTDTAVITLNIMAPVNAAPVANDDAVVATKAGQILINPADLIANDMDAEGDTLTGISLQDPVNGAVEYINGQVVFTPTAGYSGPASFTYTITDGKGGTDTATVNLTVVAEVVVEKNILHFNNIAPSVNAAPPAGWFSDNPGGVIEVLPSDVYGIPGTVSNVLELERFPGDASNFYTFVNSVYGENITLSFDYSARAGADGCKDSAIKILVNGEEFQMVNTNSVGFTPFSFEIAGTGEPMRIEFQSFNQNEVGGLLDNIFISADLVYKEGQPFNEIKGDNSDETLNGTAAQDLMTGQAGSDTLNGDAGNDNIAGGAGDDQISGGAGNDLLSGGVGADTFTWTLADTAATGIEVDTISDFANPNGSDVINVKDLLNGESHDAASLVNYLHFSVGEGKTTMYVSADGNFTEHQVGAGNQAEVLANTTQQIEFIGVDLTAGSMSDAQVIQNLLSQNKLITD